MVNSKHALFKVNKQTPANGPPSQTYSTILNCRKAVPKRATTRNTKKDAKALRFAKIPGVPWSLKQPQPPPEKGDGDEMEVDGASNTHSLSSINGREFPLARPLAASRTKLRRGKAVSKEIDLDTWFTILTFSDPAQLLEMRTRIASCYRFLRDNPMLWKHSREYYYQGTLPDLPSELTEFQYAHLRHGHGCMSCGTPSTRKTYWAFLRRWCKRCLHAKTVRQNEAVFRDSTGEDISFIAKCLPSGVFDSWGNFIGVGPARTLSYKTVYLISDVNALVDEFVTLQQRHVHATATPWVPGPWLAARMQLVEERRQFAREMELWEDNTRQSRSCEHLEKKRARKTYFAEKALQLVPPIPVRDMECCPSYRRAIAIPKEPNTTSWMQLKPKLEKEAANLRAKGRPQRPTLSLSGNSTPSTDV